jgi:hypothetical protein
MLYDLYYHIYVLLTFGSIACLASTPYDWFGLGVAKIPELDIRDNSGQVPSPLDMNPNGSTFLWLLMDEYKGDNFFECVVQLLLSCIY